MRAIEKLDQIIISIFDKIKENKDSFDIEIFYEDYKKHKKDLYEYFDIEDEVSNLCNEKLSDIIYDAIDDDCDECILTMLINQFFQYLYNCGCYKIKKDGRKIVHKIEIEDDGYKSDMVFLALDTSLLNLDSFKTFFINDDNYQSPISLLYKIFPLMETFAEKYNRKESNEVLTKLSDEIIYLVNTYIDLEEDIKVINILNYQTTTQNYDFIINMHHVDADYYSEFSNETVMFIIPKNKHDHKFDAFVNPSESFYNEIVY